MNSTIDCAPPTSSLRQRKKNATREAIHAAALSLAEDQGLASITVEAIAERADVSPRTFFNYFPSKVHAVLGRDPERAEGAARAIAGRPAHEEPLAVLRHVLLDMFVPTEVDADLVRRRFSVIRSEPALIATLHAEFEQTEKAIVAAIAKRAGLDPDRDLYPSVVVGAAVTAMRVALVRWSQQGGKEPPAPLVGEAFDMLACGLVAPWAPEGTRP